ncbi:MAG: hypothetical protein ACP5QA_15450 [Phycisphaerae bacterium]
MHNEDDLAFPDAESSERLHLEIEQKYRVTKPFVDADGKRHTTGEEWVFTGSKFSRFEDEYIISIRLTSGAFESFGLICEEDKQYEIIRNFREYVTRI